MQGISGSKLLGGAMRIALATAALAISLAALNASAQAARAPKYPLEVAITYNTVFSTNVSGSSFWMQGGSVQLQGQFWRGLGVVADVAGMHAANIDSTGVNLDMVTATFGPRYTWQPAHRRYAFFGQALGGVANAFNSVFPAPTAATTSSYSPALKMGGGMNIALSPHIALRAFEANWLRTQFPNGTTNVQNNLSLGAGIVFRI